MTVNAETPIDQGNYVEIQLIWGGLVILAVTLLDPQNDNQLMIQKYGFIMFS